MSLGLASRGVLGSSIGLATKGVIYRFSIEVIIEPPIPTPPVDRPVVGVGVPDKYLITIRVRINNKRIERKYLTSKRFAHVLATFIEKTKPIQEVAVKIINFATQKIEGIKARILK